MPRTKTKPASKGSAAAKKGSTKKASTSGKKTPAKKASTSKTSATKKKTSATRASATKKKGSSRKASSRTAKKGILGKAKQAVSNAAGATISAAKTGLQVGTAAAAAALVEDATKDSKTSA